MKTKSRIKTCVKCGSKKITRHHVFPKVFFGDGVIATLCPKCHRKLEAKIQNGESVSNGKRVSNNRQYYFDCLLEFLTKEAG
jgi:predicted nucleic-acid-binding Zn-ribbon protein